MTYFLLINRINLNKINSNHLGIILNHNIYYIIPITIIIIIHNPRNGRITMIFSNNSIMRCTIIRIIIIKLNTIALINRNSHRFLRQFIRMQIHLFMVDQMVEIIIIIHNHKYPILISSNNSP